MTRSGAITVLTLYLACSLHICHSRTLSAAQGATSCAAACTAPVLFKTARPEQPISYACAASTEAGQVVGYQLSTSPLTCTVAYEGKSSSAVDFTCLCKESSQTQGLDLPGSSGTCADSCSQSLDGEVGKALGSGGSFACLAASELGTGNRFGSQTVAKSCDYGIDGTVGTSDKFSCVCLFSVGGLAQVMSPQSTQPQLETAG